MEHPAPIGSAGTFVIASEASGTQLHTRHLPRDVSFALAIAAAFVFFVADILLPRGATAAIGYALVPALAAGGRRRSFIYWITVACTALAWVGYFLEPPGALWWMSVFDRLMVTMVLWLAMLLVLRRLSVIATLAERTEALEQASDELKRSNAELDRFASVVAHDLRGPLNSIGLVAQVLIASDRKTADSKYDSFLEGIKQEVDNMGRLIRRLLAYGHVGGGTLRVAPCDCGSVLSAVVQSLSATLETSSATVTHDPLPVLPADATLVSELFQNLIENAVKYRGEHPPHVHVCALEQNGECVIAVRDNGIGVSRADSEAIFRPFTQLRRAGGTDGVGLGLATCKRIVERHGGRIWVESPAGGGSTFCFTLGLETTDARARRVTATGSLEGSTKPISAIRSSNSWK
jgi:signal transduction histidine kinase